MALKVFQVQAKDSVVRLNAFDAINAVQNLDLDPIFNEEYFTELGNRNFTAVSNLPETRGSFEVTATGSVPAVLARMVYNYSTQTYAFDPVTKGNIFTFTEVDLENCVFDLLNLKQPGNAFTEAYLVPNAQLEELNIKVDSTGVGTETYKFVANLQEGFYQPYHDMVSIPCVTLTSGTIQVPAAYGINSGTHGIMYVFRDNTKFDPLTTSVTWTGNTTITVPQGQFTTAAPFDRVTAVLFRYVPGAFPTIYYPTTARFVRGDRVDIWLLTSGTAGSASDANRLLRCQSVDITVPLPREKLTELRRNNDQTTIYYRGLTYPLKITVNLNLNETTLQQWATLQGVPVLPVVAPNQPGVPNTNTDTVDLVSFSAQAVVLKYYVRGNDTTPLSVITLDNLFITSFSERQRIGTHAERTLSFTCSDITITGNQA